MNIEETESLARIILHSFHYKESTGKIKPEAFLPSPLEIDVVSVMRFIYTDASFCKLHGIKIAKSRNNPTNPCKFVGLAFVYSKEINEISSKCIEVKCEAIASPLDEENKIRTFPPISKSDPGLPMHADIKYSIKVEAHKPMNQMIKQYLVKEIIKIAETRFYKDEKLDNENWLGPEINI